MVQPEVQFPAAAFHEEISIVLGNQALSPNDVCTEGTNLCPKITVLLLFNPWNEAGIMSLVNKRYRPCTESNS